MEKKLPFVPMGRCVVLVLLSSLFLGEVMATGMSTNKLFSMAENENFDIQMTLSTNQQDPLLIPVTISVSKVTLAQFVQQVQKQLGSRAFINLSLDKIGDYAPTISVVANQLPLGELLKKVLNPRGLTFSNKGNVFIILKNPPKQINTLRLYVVDSSTGQPMIGVVATVTNSNRGVTTDKNGFAELFGVKQGDIVEISFMGYEKKIIKYDDSKTTYNISLKEQSQVVDEVVVTGFQVIDKRELSSAITTIKPEDLDMKGAVTIDQMLEGKAAGLMITNLSSTPGAASKVRVRSGGTFVGSREPLWVIDGVIYNNPVPLTADDINSFDNINLIGNAITGLNPEDIQSINVLKDASATAIYGTQAANGVIVVTTKRGKKGDPSIRYSGNFSISDRPGYSALNLMNSKERVDVSREIYERNLPYPADIFSYIGYEGALKKYLSNDISFEGFQSEVNKVETMNTDWFDELFRPTISQTHNVSISGGGDKTRYFYSIGYNKTPGSEKGVDLNRLTTRANLDIDLRKNLIVSVGINGSYQKAGYNHSGLNAFNEAYYNSRAMPARDESGNYAYVENKIDEYKGKIQTANYNIMKEMDNSEKNITNKELAINASITWDPARWVKFTADGSFRTTTNIQEEWITEDTYYIAKLRTYESFEDKIDEIVKANASVPFGGIFSCGITSQNSYSGRAQVSFRKSFLDKHHLNLNLGTQVTSSVYWGANGINVPGYNHSQGRGFITLPRYSIDPSTQDLVFDYSAMTGWLTGQADYDIYPSITDKTLNNLSMFMIFSYSFDNRYIVNFNMRSDGSNAFGQYERYKFKPTWSVSGRYNLHNEPFMQDFTALSELGLRVSYGFRGTSPTASPYMIINNYIYNADYNENLGTISSFPNANLTWEKTSTLNVGLDHSWFDGRLSGTFDFGYSYGSDLILKRAVSLVNGQKNQMYNGGSKEDFSYEAALRGVIIKKKDWGLSMSANVTHVKENILAGYESKVLTVDSYLNGSIYLTGFPIDAFYSYQFDGLNDKGEPTYKNLTSGGTVGEYFSKVLTYSGNRTPKYYGGFNTEVRYKNLTMRASFSYKFGQSVRLLPLYQGGQNMPMPSENMNAEFNNRWRHSGDEAWATIPGLSGSALRASPNSTEMRVTYDQIATGKTGWTMYDKSDIRVVKGDFIRLQNISLNYSLPKKWLKNIGIKTITVGTQIANVAVWAFDPKLKGQDPEQVQNVGMPTLPRINFDLSISF